MIRTSLVIDFLGSGKTTSILYLLAQKSADGKWVAPVNEFGKVGIDDVLLVDSNALLKEIPGDCMCYVNSLLIQAGLNALPHQGRPDHLLVEPVGLGHPEQTFDILAAAVYEPWIDLHATVYILDPRQLLDGKVVDSNNFRDRLAAADVIVANRNNRETPEDAHALADRWQCWDGDHRKVSTTQSNIDLVLLNEPRRSTASLPASAEHVHHSRPTSGLAALSLPEHQRRHCHLNSDQGYQAYGWIFDAGTIFETIGLLGQARLAPVACAKGVMRATERVVRINRQDEDQHVEILDVPPSGS